MMKIMLEIPDKTHIMTVQCLHWDYERGCYTVTQAALNSTDIENASVKKMSKKEE